MSFTIVPKLTFKSRVCYRMFLSQNSQIGRLWSCDLQLYFMLALFHDKKCCNCINFVSCILWDFIILSLVLSWWRIEYEIMNQCSFATRSREVRKKSNHLQKRNVRSTCWKLKSHARLSILRVSREKGQPARYPQNSLPEEF